MRVSYGEQYNVTRRAESDRLSVSQRFKASKEDLMNKKQKGNQGIFLASIAAMLMFVPGAALPEAPTNKANKLVGFYTIFKSNTNHHQRARLLVLRTARNPDEKFGLVFQVTRGKGSGDAMVCSKATSIMSGDGLMCDQMYKDKAGKDRKETLIVAQATTTFCANINNAWTEQKCDDEGFRRCACYQIKHFCDTDNDGDYDDPCPGGDEGAGAGPPPGGSGSGGSRR